MTDPPAINVRVITGIGLLLIFFGLQLADLLGHDVPVHERLTQQALAYWVSERPGLAACETPDISTFLLKGVREEDFTFQNTQEISLTDAGLGRFFFHFLQQLNDRVNSRRAVLATGSCDSLTWGFSALPCDAKIVEPTTSLTIAKQLDRTNAFRYQNALPLLAEQTGTQAKTLGWEAIGHLLHLLEDLTSPPHSNNDAHPHPDNPLLNAWLGDQSQFEVVNDNHDALPVPPSGMLRRVAVDGEYNSEMTFFRELQVFVSSNFVSEKNVTRVLSWPEPVTETDGYLVSTPKHCIVPDGHACAEPIKLARISHIRPVSIDKTVAKEQFWRLAQTTIIYVASLLNFIHENRAPVCEEQLSVTIDGAGAVSSSPDGLACFVGTCFRYFPADRDISLVASPAVGSRFVRWSGACSSSGACSVRMDALDPKRVTAVFTPVLNLNPTAGFTMTAEGLTPKDNGETLTVTVPSGGTAVVNVAAADCSPGPATGCSYDPDGHIFSRAWTLDGNPLTTFPTDTLPLELTPGTHTVTLIVTDDRNAQSAAASGTIVVSTTATSIIINGSFESGPFPGSFVNLTGGTTSIAGWTVTGEGIDYIGTLWAASDGTHSLDLDGSVASLITPPFVHGGISQTFATTPGTNYLVTFDMAGNPDNLPTIKPMRVAAAGVFMDFTFDITGKSFSNMGWLRKNWTFTATDVLTTLEFHSLTISPLTGWGPALDNVSVTPLGTALRVDARANLWGAGGQGAANVGGGIDPPGVSFTAALGQVLTFASVTGTTYIGCGALTWGPDGDLSGSDGFVPALGQISGVNYNRGCSLPLFGVFLGPSLPSTPPVSLDFTQIGYSFSDLSPELGQLFFIGDGLTGTGSGAIQRFHVPAGTTRLYLGVLDGPGFWDDNSGALDAAFTITAGNQNQSPTAGFTMTASPYVVPNGQVPLNLIAPSGGNIMVTLSTPICGQNQTVGCSRDTDGQIAGRQWTVDGMPASTLETFLVPFSAGPHTVQLVVTDNLGQPSQAAQANVVVTAVTTLASVRQISNTFLGQTSVFSENVALERDGSRIAFSVEQVGVVGARLFVGSTTGVSPVDITPPNLRVINRRIGMAHGHLTFVACQIDLGQCIPGAFGDAFVMNTDGSRLVQLSTGGGIIDPGPVISADGMTVGFRQSEFFAPSKIFLSRFDGVTWTTMPVTIPGSGGCDNCTFVLNTDGSLMLLETADSQHIYYLNLARTDGTLTQTLVQLSATGFGVFLNKAFSGDGRTIAYAHDCCIYAFRVGDNAPTIVDATGISPSLSFDGSSVAYTKARDIFVADRTGDNRQNVTNSGLVDTLIVARSENGATVAFLSQADLDPGKNVDGSTDAFVAFLSPSLAIDGGAASCRPQSDTFQFTGFGFRPNQPVRRFLRQADNQVIELAPLLSADGNGKISWPFPSDAARPPIGRYTVWSLDVASGRPSNPVIEVVSATAPCSPVP